MFLLSVGTAVVVERWARLFEVGVPEPELFGRYIGVVPQGLEEGFGGEKKYLFEEGPGVLAGNAGAVVGLLGGGE